MGPPGRARVSERKPQRFARLRMVVGEILQDVRGSVSHVRHTDRRGCRLRIDELAYVFQLRTEAGVGSVIDQDEELKSCVLSLQRQPVRNFSPIVTLISRLMTGTLEP